MAQAVKTFFDLGGPQYVADPRVQEQIALGELLLRNRQAAEIQNERLFQRKQATADFDERRRQFNEEQKRLADAAKMNAADADRRSGLAERELAQRASTEQARLAGDAEDRLFRRAEAGERRDDRLADNARADRSDATQAQRYEQSVARDDTRYQEQRSDRKQDQTMDRLEQIRQDALRQAAQAGQDEQRIRADISRMDEKRLDRQADADEWRAKIAFAEDREKAKAEKTLGTVEDQRTVGVQNTLARFEEEVTRAKSAKDEQSKQEALASAVQRVLFPPPDANGRDNTDVLDGSGRRVPVWRPTPEELEALKPALLEVMARHFPAVKKAGYPKVAQVLDVPLVAPLTQAASRGAYELSGLLGSGAKETVGDWLSIPRWTQDMGAEALTETLKRNEKAQALFKRR